DPSRRSQRTLDAANAHLDAGSFEIAAGLLATAEAAPLDEMQRARLENLQARRATFGGDIRDAAALMVDAAQRFEGLDINVARATYLQALGAALLGGSLANRAGIDEVARAAGRCPMPAVPQTGDWLLTGLAQATTDGPAIAAPALRRALAALPKETSFAGRIHVPGHQCAAPPGL